MANLVVTLGISPAIVPEAFLIGEHIDAVRIITSMKTAIEPVADFFAKHAPQVRVEFYRVDGFADMVTERDHFLFEEVLYRWFLEDLSSPAERLVCISGGYKTMSAAMQKAANLFGAAEVFHVLADRCCADPGGPPREPRDADEVLMARRNGHLHYVRLGPEAGWPQLAQFEPKDFPLHREKGKDPHEWIIRAPDDGLRRYIQSLLERSRAVYGRLDSVVEMPFPIMASWPEPVLKWLDEPLNPKHDAAWIRALPKIELHTHLGGFATQGRLLEEVRAAADRPHKLPPLREIEWPEEWPFPLESIPLRQYMRLGDNNGSYILKDAGCLRKQCELLYRHFQQEHIVYAEVRCSPANYACQDRSPWDVLSDIRSAFSSLMRKAREEGEFFCHVNLVVIATRKGQGNERSAIARHIALAVTAADQWNDSDDCQIVGVDLAGFEDPSTRPHYYREEFTAIHRCGIAVTIHAGENDDVEAIWRAVLDLQARRIGHALHLHESRELMRSFADRRIGVELCPFANMQIGGYTPSDSLRGAVSREEYPLVLYLREGLPVTINTDNIGISGAGLSDNILLASRLSPGFTRRDVLQTLRNAADVCFASVQVRNNLIRRISSLLTMPAVHHNIRAEHLVESPPWNNFTSSPSVSAC